jgi:hypothetical protein
MDGLEKKTQTVPAHFLEHDHELDEEERSRSGSRAAAGEL